MTNLGRIILLQVLSSFVYRSQFFLYMFLTFSRCKCLSRFLGLFVFCQLRIIYLTALSVVKKQSVVSNHQICRYTIEFSLQFIVAKFRCKFNSVNARHFHSEILTELSTKNFYIYIFILIAILVLVLSVVHGSAWQQAGS